MSVHTPSRSKPVEQSAPETTVAAELITALATSEPTAPGREALRARTIEAWLPLANHLARRYSGRGEPTDDLTQVATVGLIKAIDRYETGRGVDFPGFAVPTVLGEIKRHFRDRTWSIRVPRRLQELRLAIGGANNTLAQQLGRSPTIADIARHLGISEEEVVEGLEGARAYSATSLSTPIGDESGTELGDTMGADDAGYALTDFRVSLGPAMAVLDDRERRILSLRFDGNLTQVQIANQLGISQMHVSRLISRSLAKLRQQLES